jgi:hypothetical protein
MRGKQTVRDMVLSMAVIGVVVAAIYVFLPRGGSDPVKPISYRVELGQARHAAPYPVAAPAGLSGQWRATSVTYDGSDRANAQWHLGFIDPENQYVAVEQTNGDPAPFVADKTQQSHAAGTQPVAGTGWTRYDGGRYRALVHRQGSVTTMVTGTAPYDQLERLAAALRTS